MKIIIAPGSIWGNTVDEIGICVFLHIFVLMATFSFPSGLPLSNPEYYAVYIQQIGEDSDGQNVNSDDSVCLDCDDTDEHYDSHGDHDDSDIENVQYDHSATNDNENKPLFEGSLVTLKTAIVLIMSFVNRHKLAKTVLEDLLQLLEVFCPKLNLSVSKLYRFLENAKYSTQQHYYCSKCLFYIRDPDNMHVCPVPTCNARLCREDKSLSYFLVLPLVEQIQELCKDEYIESCMFGAKRQFPSQDGVIRDIKDGNIYRSFMASHSENRKSVFSLLWNTDGVSIFRSSNTNIWPFYLVINELPFEIRFSRPHMLMCGLWHGQMTKPLMNTYLQPILDELLKLENGFEINTVSGVKNVQGYLLAGTADLPAKSLVLCMVNFNAAFSCHKCLQQGENFRTEPGRGRTQGGNVHVNRYEIAEERTDISIIEDGIKALSGVVNRGMKGVPTFAYLSHYSVSQGTSIDQMHGIHLGIICKTLSLLSDPKGPCQLSKDKLDLLNKRLLSLKPPHVIKRSVRSLSDVSHFKAAEYCSILLMYIPIFVGILPDDQFEHLLCLSHIMFTLNKTTIDQADIAECEILIDAYCKDFGEIYGLRYQTTNFHNLRHLVQDVRNLGPLFHFDCYPFEDASGQFVKLLHGTQHIDSQLTRCLAVCQKLPAMVKECYNDFERLQGNKLVESLLGTKKEMGRKIDENLYVLGAAHAVSDDVNIAGLVGGYFGLWPSEMKVQTYFRMKAHGTIMHSVMYSRSKNRNSYTVKYGPQAEMYAFVRQYLVVEINDDVYGFAVVQKLRCLETQTGPAKHLKRIEKPNGDCDEHILVPLNQIEELCVFVGVEDTNLCYLSRVPYHYIMR